MAYTDSPDLFWTPEVVIESFTVWLTLQMTLSIIPGQQSSHLVHRQTDRRTDRPDRQTDRQTDREREREGQTERQTDRETDRQTYRQTRRVSEITSVTNHCIIVYTFPSRAVLKPASVRIMTILRLPSLHPTF